MSNWYCDKCEGAADEITHVNGTTEDLGLCPPCYEDWEFVQQRGQLFSWGDACFVGHDTGETWNGFEVPMFSRNEIMAVLTYSRDVLGTVTDIKERNGVISFHWYSETGTHILIANEMGFYTWHGIAWASLELDEEWTLDKINERIAFNLQNNETDAHGFIEDFRDEILDTWHGASENTDTLTFLRNYIDNH